MESTRGDVSLLFCPGPGFSPSKPRELWPSTLWRLEARSACSRWSHVWTLVVAAQRGVAVPCEASELRQWIWAGRVPELALGSPGTTGLQGLEVSGGRGGSCRKLSWGAGATRRACGMRARTGLGHE